MRYCDRCGVSQLAIGADNEILKRVPTIEIGIDGALVPLVGARCIPRKLDFSVLVCRELSLTVSWFAELSFKVTVTG